MRPIRSSWSILAPLLLGAALAPFLVACESNQVTDVCCRDFTPGADLSAVDWHIEDVAARAEFGVFLQAAADFSGAASAVLSDVSNACKAIALDLAATDEDQKAALGSDDAAERAGAWCALARGRIDATVNAGGKATLRFQAPSCAANAEAQGRCEARCAGKSGCEVTPAALVARCDPAALRGRCEGSCTGTCEGSANLAVSCQGTCEGTCEGTCDGAAMPTGATGPCAGLCAGKCRGACVPSAGGGAACDGECIGGCSVDLQAPRCNGALAPAEAGCRGPTSCAGSCGAIAGAKAECKDPSVEIVASGDVPAGALASLKLYLPRILVVAKARGELLRAQAEAALMAGALVSGQAPDLSAKAAACVVPAVSAMSAAAANVDAALSASSKVMAAFEP